MKTSIETNRAHVDRRTLRGHTGAVTVALLLALSACGGGGGSSSGSGDTSLSEANGACGNVSIARMDWDSAGILAEVDSLILREGFGCTSSLVDGDTLPTFQSMRDGNGPDLAPELWIDAFRDSLNESVEAGDVRITVRSLTDGGVEGFWIPRYVAEDNPDIRSVDDALMRPELFPSPEGRALSAFHNCPPGWNCNVISENLFRAHGAGGKGFELIDPLTGEGLDDSIARAFDRQEGWLGYYWSPTALMGRYDMVKLESPSFDQAEWVRCTSVANCADPIPNGYRTSDVVSLVTTEFAERAGRAMDYLTARQWRNDTVNSLLAWRADNEASPAEAAIHFLKNDEAVWTSWVDEATADRIRAAL